MNCKKAFWGVSILTFLLFTSLVYGQKDWLIDATGYPAKITTTDSGKAIQLSNGLVSRTIRISPNAATVSFFNLATEEEFVRSVRPEAEIEIDSLIFPIGGLLGQPVHNYLLPEWIETMKADPAAFQFTGFTTGETKERFTWKKRLSWMPEDLPWPPPGKSLHLTFQATGQTIDALLARFVTDKNRQVLLDDDFHRLSQAWKVYTSPGYERNSFINEGKAGEIMARAHNAVFAERPLPGAARVILCKIDPGTDKGYAWGPGITIVFPSKTIKVNVRPAGKKFGFHADGTEVLVDGVQPGKSCWLKMKIGENVVTGSFSYDGSHWQEIGTAPIQPGQKPGSVRIGKTDWSGGNTDHPSQGEPGRCRIEQFLVYGDLLPATRSAIRKKYDYLKKVAVTVHYEIYDGIPLLSKWVTLKNGSKKQITVQSFKSEILAVTEPESSVGVPPNRRYPNMTVETDYAFGGGMSSTSCIGKSVFWETDPLYLTQVNYRRKTPCLLVCRPQYGPAQKVIPNTAFSTFRTFELLHDNWDRERKGLAQRRMYRTIAPWVTENPILMHVRQADDQSVKLAIDQCAAVGFEMVILTFGSGFNLEDESAANLARMKKLADYAHAKGIALGGYSLLASRKVGGGNDVVMPKGMKPRFGNSPCLESEWGRDYFRKLIRFYQKTGMDILEHDGSYPGDVCAASSHPGHDGLPDSQWKQFTEIRDFYRRCRGNGIYLNVPDWYFLNGSNKTGMGYRETNWSLPRKQQEIIERQNIYDGTWEKTPSMGWMFVPLTQYHGGGAAATIEPLKNHLTHYGQRLKNLFGAGVQACYRGPRLFDAPETEAVVRKWVDFYRKYRPILDSDIIHVRRPDGRNLDCILHVNPKLQIKGLAMVYNPTGPNITEQLRLPLYYTGLTDAVKIREQAGEEKIFQLNRKYEITLPVEVAGHGTTWFTIE